MEAPVIVVEVKLVSAHGRQYDQLLGTTIISNVGTTPDGKYGDYDVAVGRKTDAADLRKVYNSPLRRTKVLRHPRLAQNVWRLVLKALASAFPNKKVILLDEDSIDHEAAQAKAKAIDKDLVAYPLADGTWQVTTPEGPYNFRLHNDGH